MRERLSTVTVDTQISALLEFASGPIATARFSFDEPIATRELEVHGTGGVIRLPDPNAFDGSVFVCKKDLNKTTPNEWLDAPTDADWTEFPAEGSAEGRGMGALDLARAVRSGGSPPRQRRSGPPRPRHHGVDHPIGRLGTNSFLSDDLQAGRAIIGDLESASEIHTITPQTSRTNLQTMARHPIQDGLDLVSWPARITTTHRSVSYDARPSPPAFLSNKLSQASLPARISRKSGPVECATKLQPLAETSCD